MNVTEVDFNDRSLNGNDLTAAIRYNLSLLGYKPFRANVGKVRVYEKDKNGKVKEPPRLFDTGLPKGFSDTFSIKDGRVVFIEVKGKGDKIRPEQIEFINEMRSCGCRAGVAYTVQEAIDIAEGRTGD